MSVSVKITTELMKDYVKIAKCKIYFKILIELYVLHVCYSDLIKNMIFYL